MMRLLLWIGLVLICSGLMQPIGAQDQPPVSDSTLVFGDLTTQRDTIDAFQPSPYPIPRYIRPSSATVYVNGTPADPARYTLDLRAATLAFDPPLASDDTLVIAYRRWPLSATARSQEETEGQRPPADQIADPDTSAPAPGAYDPFEGVRLQRSGSISRGIVGGTQRDARLESGLRLDLEGDLTDEVSVRATLTDEDTPIQPDGTTQRLSEFDRVFIEIDAPPGTAQLGDVEASFQQSPFASYDRLLQGGQLRSSTFSAGPAQVQAQAVGAVARGLFRRQEIDAEDGVQGPYRLRGREGEPFIVITAGSERVFLDGERLERGESNDYVIDYARSEITFTADRLITSDRRITVEFQYTATPFTRSLLGTEADAALWRRSDGSARLEVGATVLREADGGDFAAALGLSPEDSTALANAGTSTVTRSGATRVEFDPEAPFVQYRRDTVAGPDGTPDTIFVALTERPDEDEPVFRVQFTRVGPGQGSYQRGGAQQNGIAYTYVGPGQGRYTPERPLPRPQAQRVVDLRAATEPWAGWRLAGNWAQSRVDANRFASGQDTQTQAHAYRIRLNTDPQPLSVGGYDAGTLQAQATRAVRQAQFEPFERGRSVEFNRRWNVERTGAELPDTLQAQGRESISEITTTWAPTDAAALSGEWGRLSVGQAFRSTRWQGRAQYAPQTGLRGEYTGTWIESARSEEQGRWIRQTARLARAGAETWRPALDGRFERRMQRAGAGALQRNSFQLWEVEPRLTFDPAQWTLTAQGGLRAEQEEAEGQLQPAAQAWQAGLSADYAGSGATRFQVEGRYRTRSVREFFRLNRQARDSETLLVRAELATAAAQRAVDLDVSYQGQTERTPTVQETFIRVGPELGQFVWTDANDDGIPQIDEFIPETTPGEGEYIQSFVPSDSLVPVANVQAQMQLRLDPGRVWDDASSPVARALSVVQSRSEARIQEQTESPNLWGVYLLDPREYRQPGQTVNGQLDLRQTLDLFPRRSRAGGTLEWTQRRRLDDRSAGLQEAFQQAWSATTRWRPVRPWQVQLQAETERDRSTSEAFESRSYDIRTWRLQPESEIDLTPAWQLQVRPSWAQKTDRRGTRRATVWRAPVEATWRRARQARLSAQAEVAHIALQGDAQGRALFELTDGRGAGTSYLWGLRGRYVFSDLLQGSLRYNGRAPAAADVIHTFEVELTATF
ncbi:hypothetical protein CRI93_01275 [Longimonas halophila]|uniref:Cell surface protein SprA n=1 Tax=Longimonas halophila TaxID=1469170 RepID=A0A2H3P907_9BACT|nr:hypothetical protein [Longimonas halophila]PEN09385.1 hypothetical protein CRI93_01275 [Longimonas halophila]